MGFSLHNKLQNSSTLESEQLLRSIGFNKYEASAYLTLLEEGFTDASVLSKKSKIPMGKIYSVLDNLENVGFIEVQHSRPKKYRAIEANIALENYFMFKENEIKKEMNTLRKSIDVLKKALSNYSVQGEKEKHFWSAAMGSDEVMKMIKNVYHEAKNEICVVVPGNIRSMEPNQFKNMFTSMFHNTLLPLVKKGVKIRMIDPNPALSEALKEWYNSTEDGVSMKILSEHLQIKALDTPNRFILIDLDLVILEINDPLSAENIFGMIKIYDRDLSNELHAKFEEFWQKGKNKLSYGY
ncbi:TrmB family transcriptional regulator [Methanomethylovorans sp.]|uniref:TrmB family transcriptional regulator n=1 Tax=Methanomethylovorans sp. TaxID=2758717 RepID=UPI000A98008D|nr:helix-turn-helix domain-containing protein [Methanomethylovorans sp.]